MSLVPRRQATNWDRASSSQVLPCCMTAEGGLIMMMTYAVRMFVMVSRHMRTQSAATAMSIDSPGEKIKMRRLRRVDKPQPSVISPDGPSTARLQTDSSPGTQPVRVRSASEYQTRSWANICWRSFPSGAHRVHQTPSAPQRLPVAAWYSLPPSQPHDTEVHT